MDRRTDSIQYLTKISLAIASIAIAWGAFDSVTAAIAQVSSPSPDPSSTPETSPDWGADRPVDIEAYRKSLIIGTWRGFQTAEDVTLYCGYEFRGDGTFNTRQRLYRQDNVLEDSVGRGKWDFDGQILAVTGVSLGAKPQAIALRFELGKDGSLYYRDGNWPDRYQGFKMGKLNRP